MEEAPWKNLKYPFFFQVSALRFLIRLMLSSCSFIYFFYHPSIHASQGHLSCWAGRTKHMLSSCGYSPHLQVGLQRSEQWQALQVLGHENVSQCSSLTPVPWSCLFDTLRVLSTFLHLSTLVLLSVADSSLFPARPFFYFGHPSLELARLLLLAMLLLALDSLTIPGGFMRLMCHLLAR